MKVLTIYLLLAAVLLALVGCSRTSAVVETNIPIKESPFSDMANKKVILRNDDVEIGDNVSIALRWLSDLIVDNDIKMTYAVIPAQIQNKPNIINYLRNLSLDTDHFEMGTHGYAHEEFEKLSYDAQYQLLKRATDLMMEYFSRAPLTFLPPYQSANIETTRALKALGYHTMASIRAYSAPYVETDFAMNDFGWELNWSPMTFATYADFVKAFDDFYDRDQSRSPNGFFVIQSHHSAFMDSSGKLLATVTSDYEKSIAYMKTKNVEFMTMEEGYEWVNDLSSIRTGKRGENTYFINFRGCEYEHTVKFQAPQGWAGRMLVRDPATEEAIYLPGPYIEFNGLPGHEYQVINTGSIAGNVNRPPALTAIGDKAGNGGELLTFTVNATDPDGDMLRYTASDLPPGAKFNTRTNTFSWTPVEGGLYSGIHFEVTDGELKDAEDININVNIAPQLDPVGNQKINEGKLLQITVSGSDPDGDNLSYSASNLPQGAVFNPPSRAFSWTPAVGQEGIYPDISFSVSDGKLSASENITVRIYHAGYMMPSVSVNTTTPSAKTIDQKKAEVSFVSGGSENLSGLIDWNRSLAGYWSFDEGSGTTANDKSTYSNNGTLSGGPEWVTGNFGNALKFDGNDDYVSVSNNSSFNFGTGDYTVEFWVNNSEPLQTEDDLYTIASKVSGGANGIGWSCLLRGGAYHGIYFRFYYPPRYSGAEIIPDIDLTGNVTDGNWHYFAAARSSGNVTLYFDGNRVGWKVCAKDITNSVPLYIGTFEPGSYSKLKASVDEFRIWSRALTEEEIKASFNAKVNRLYLTLTDLPDGTFDYYAYITDIYGNYAQTDTRTINVSSGG